MRSFARIEPPIATRAAGLDRLEEWLPKAGKVYQSDRNTDYGPGNHQSVSCLSPYLRHRLVREEEVIARVLQRFSFSTAEKFIEEVVWRGYFKGWLEQRPGVWQDYRAELHRQQAALQSDADLKARYRAAISGQTGIDGFDFWAEELARTGYLHNHARMWAASIWIFTLGLPWVLGADWFYRYLLDGDAASNTLSWRWIAGLHTQGKTYLARPANIAKFTNGRFHPKAGQLADEAPAVEGPSPPRPAMPPDPRPLPEDEAVGLLITEDDGHAESLPVNAPVAGVLGLTCTQARSAWTVGDLPRHFAFKAVENATTRAGDHFGVDARLSRTDDWAETLVAWARDNAVTRIATGYAPQGPVREALDAAKPALTRAGVDLYEVRRRYDALIWPHASAGFFRVKKQIPQILGQLSLV